MYKIWLTGYVYPVKMKHKRSIFRCLLYWKVKLLLILSHYYDFDTSRELLNSFKTLTILSIIWSSAPLRPDSSVGNNESCQSRGSELELSLGRHSFRHLTSHCDKHLSSSTNGQTGYVEKHLVACTTCCVECSKKAMKHMGR